MSRKIEELTLDEAKELIDNITIRNKQLEIQKVQLRKQRDKLKDEQKSIRDSRKKKLNALQVVINKTKGKLYKDRKREEKQRETGYFDNRIKSKEREINTVRDKINKIDENKAYNNKLIAEIRKHINSLKN